MIARQTLGGILAGWLLLAAAAGGQTRPVQPDGRTILDYVRILSADDMEGRGSGQPGLEKAAAYAADKFKEWGLEPAGENGTFFQRFPLKELFQVQPGGSLSILVGRDRREFFNQPRAADWRVSTYSGSGRIEAEIVFVGYGIHAPEAGYDDYAGLDARGKIVLLSLAGTPPKEGLGAAASPQARLRAARDLGAAAALLCPRASLIPGRNPYPAGYYGDASIYGEDFPIVGIADKITSFIFDTLPVDASTVFDQLDAAPAKPRSFATGIKAALDVRTSYMPQADAVNVLARIPGSDRGPDHETVLLGAHLDGLGLDADGGVMNGADDNASGSAVVMETARLLRVNGVKPRRTLVFALWGGEEIGLLGSDHFARHPLFRLDRTAAYLNLDMVGQGGGKLQFGGVYHGPEVWSFLKAKLPAEVMADIVPAPSGGGSDQISFVARGVPGFHLVGTRPHDKGHHPGDDIELIRPELLARSCRFLYLAAEALASAGPGLIGPDRTAWVLFRNQTVIGQRRMTPAELLAKAGLETYSDTDVQLVRLEDKAGLGPAETKLDWLNQIRELETALAAKPGFQILSDDPSDRMRAGSRTRLVPGLDANPALRDDPSILAALAKLGLRWIALGASDLAGSGGAIDEPGRKLLAAAQEAGLLVILDGPPESLLREALAAAAKPLLTVAGEVPTADVLALMKEKRTCLGLRFAAGSAAPAYRAALKAAADGLGTAKVSVWMEDDLWTRPAKEAMVRLIGALAAERWTDAPTRTSAFETRGLAGLMAGAFLQALREAASQRP